jgi:WD40 repeat protein
MDRLPICSIWSEHIFVGGLWGGKILKYDLITRETEIHTKHSDTVTAIAADEELALVVSGTVSGEVIVWEYLNKGQATSSGYTHTSRKLIYRQKIVAHYSCINGIHVHSDLRVAVCSGQDGLVTIIDLERYETIRTLKIGIPVSTSLLLKYPYYMLFIACEQNKQFCYSLNGQLLDEANF